MSALQRRGVAAVLALGLLLALLLLLAWDAQHGLNGPERYVLRDVQLYEPPPPPPPQQVRPAAAAAALPRLNLSRQAQSVQLETMPLHLDLPAGTAEGLGQGFGGLVDGIGSGMPTVGLSELDSQPMVLAAPMLSYPRHLKDRDILEFTVIFHIVIDEQGNTHPVRLLQNAHPELEDMLMDFARQTRFSPPLRLGVAVRTEYSWPVVFRSEQ